MIIDTSIFLQLQQPRDENGDPPGRYRLARCGNLNHTGWLLIGWGSWSQCAARVDPRANVEVASLTGRLWFHPRIRNPSKSLQLQEMGTKTVIARVDTASHDVVTPTQGTLLLIGVREASRPHPMGATEVEQIHSLLSNSVELPVNHHGVVVRLTDEHVPPSLDAAQQEKICRAKSAYSCACIPKHLTLKWYFKYTINRRANAKA